MFKKVDGFIFCLIIVLFISSQIPSQWVENTHASISKICNVGIALIFFLYGLKMNKSDIKKGLSNYKLHLLVHLSTFLLFPLLAYAFRPVFMQIGISDFWIGLLFLAALPSTVSSSVVMVSIAKGNIPAAIFNASISGLIGVFLTPIWMNVDGSDIQFLDTLMKLSFTILLPVFAGLLLNSFWGGFVKKHKAKLALFDKGIILLIVYNSFSEAFSSGLFSQFSAKHILYVASFTLLLLLISYGSIYLVSKLLGFSVEDQITACFCGSKKSLVHGSVMIQAIFKGAASQAIILLPIMMYHSIQLFLVGFVAQQYAKRNNKDKQ